MTTTKTKTKKTARIASARYSVMRFRRDSFTPSGQPELDGHTYSRHRSLSGAAIGLETLRTLSPMANAVIVIHHRDGSVSQAPQT